MTPVSRPLQTSTLLRTRSPWVITSAAVRGSSRRIPPHLANLCNVQRPRAVLETGLHPRLAEAEVTARPFPVNALPPVSMARICMRSRRFDAAEQLRARSAPARESAWIGPPGKGSAARKVGTLTARRGRRAAGRVASSSCTLRRRHVHHSGQPRIEFAYVDGDSTAGRAVAATSPCATPAPASLDRRKEEAARAVGLFRRRVANALTSQAIQRDIGTIARSEQSALSLTLLITWVTVPLAEATRALRSSEYSFAAGAPSALGFGP
jgi:hypothetical protein